MGRQRDDGVGRIQLHPQSLFRYRRQILRAIRRNTNAYTNYKCNCDADSFA
jgi:hypothetical protein